MKKLLLIIIVIITLTGCDKVDKKNIMKKLQGVWISKNTIIYDVNTNEHMHTYLIFKDNQVLYTGYTDYEFKNVTIYSKSNMYFGNQNWYYEYIDKNTLIHNGNVYNKLTNDDIDVKLISTTESSIENPLLVYNISNIDYILDESRFYIINEYIRFEGLNNVGSQIKHEKNFIIIKDFVFYFPDNADVNNLGESIVCVGTYERKKFNECKNVG